MNEDDSNDVSSKFNSSIIKELLNSTLSSYISFISYQGLEIDHQ